MENPSRYENYSDQDDRVYYQNQSDSNHRVYYQNQSDNNHRVYYQNRTGYKAPPYYGDHISVNYPVYVFIIGLIIVNGIVFFLKLLTPADYGISVLSVIGEREYYRLFSYMFIHNSLQHIGANCFSLFVTGQYLSERKGLPFIAFVYFAGGILGGLASILWNLLITGRYEALTVGASGAVFALLGLIFTLNLLFGRRNLFMVLAGAALCLYSNAGEGIDSAAHVGGFITGVIICLAATLFSRFKRHLN